MRVIIKFFIEVKFAWHTFNFVIIVSVSSMNLVTSDLDRMGKHIAYKVAVSTNVRKCHH